MRLKKLALLAAMMVFMVFAISSVADQTYAYWASNVGAPTNQSISNTATIGSWTFISEWDSNTTYSAGDTVEWQGRTYRANRSSTGVEPRGPWYWWFFWSDIT